MDERCNNLTTHIRTEFEETIYSYVEGVLRLLTNGTNSLRVELNSEKGRTTREFHMELVVEDQGTRLIIHTTKTLVDATRQISERERGAAAQGSGLCVLLAHPGGRWRVELAVVRIEQ
jgi:hypothetical protein